MLIFNWEKPSILLIVQLLYVCWFWREARSNIRDPIVTIQKVCFGGKKVNVKEWVVTTDDSVPCYNTQVHFDYFKIN